MIAITEENSDLFKGLLVTAAILGGRETLIGKRKVHIIEEKNLYDHIEMLIQERGEHHGLRTDKARVYAEVLPYTPVMKELIKEGKIELIKCGKNDLCYIVTKLALNGEHNYSGTWM